MTKDLIVIECDGYRAKLIVGTGIRKEGSLLKKLSEYRDLIGYKFNSLEWIYYA